MIYVSSQALTEPIFICFVLIALIMLGEFFETERSAMFYSAALMIGLSCLVRYVGIAFVATGGLAILILSKTRWTSRLLAAFKFGFIGSLPLAIWIGRNLFAGGSATNRTFSFHPPALKDLVPVIDTAGYWLLPISTVENLPFLSRAVVGVIAKPKPHVVVPRSMGFTVAVQRSMPRGIAEAIGRALGTGRVFTSDVDVDKRKSYARRTGTS